jgi:DNA repair exonuclease SbcCD nuclease subunit
MIEQQIDIGLDSIDKIFHFGDIHWRNFKRHDEYFTVFNRALEIVRKHKTPNSIVYLAGDIVHAKTDMSPELVEAVQKFFRMFADELPTILITGNHDCNLNNKNRLDALTPIVNALKHESLYYLRDSGVYSIAGLKFVVMSVFDKPVDYIKAKDVEDGYKIALYHGAVDSSTNDQGFRLTNSHVTVNLFDGYDLVLMGDIHKRQTLQEYKEEYIEVDESELNLYLNNGWQIDE